MLLKRMLLHLLRKSMPPQISLSNDLFADNHADSKSVKNWNGEILFRSYMGT